MDSEILLVHFYLAVSKIDLVISPIRFSHATNLNLFLQYRKIGFTTKIFLLEYFCVSQNRFYGITNSCLFCDITESIF